MGWFSETLEKIKGQSTALFMGWVAAKFVFGVGLGCLLAFYLPQYNWQLFGWALILLSILLGIPTLYTIFIKK